MESSMNDSIYPDDFIEEDIEESVQSSNSFQFIYFCLDKDIEEELK